MPRLAVIQRPSVWLDKAACIERAVIAIGEAKAGGADLVIFPEAYIPGYPSWIWRLRPGGDMKLSEELHAGLVANAIRIGSDDLSAIQKSAVEHGVWVVCGMHERDAEFGRSTIYNTVVMIAPDGAIANRHRKLMPTNPERMVWGMGDASGLKVVETPHGRLGTLICWENYMPLARYALYAQGVEIYIAPTYDAGARWSASMQHIAMESGAWVVSAGVALHARDVPESLPGKTALYPKTDEWINPGDSMIVAPGGKIVAGPLHEEYGILYGEIDLERVGIARRSLDTTGHYARPDLFRLQVDRRARLPVELGDDD